MIHKLGLLPKVADPRALKLKSYLNLSTLPTPPSEYDWSMALTQPWGMYANGPDKSNPSEIPDGVGDCFFAMHAHRRLIATANANTIMAPSVADCVAAYSGATGFSLANPQSTDNGTEPNAGMRFMKATGMGGWKIGPWVEVDWTNADEMHAAGWLFGHLFVGIQFPADYEKATVWGATNSQIEGGHAILSFGAKADGCIWIDTWGSDRVFTPDGVKQNVTWMAAAVCDDWMMPLADPDSPSGFDKEHLLADLAAVGAVQMARCGMGA